VVQKFSLDTLLLAFSAISPAPSDPNYSITHNFPTKFPDQTGNRDLWARAAKTTVSITVSELDADAEAVLGGFSSGFSSGFEI
jgi:hypothetical protein